VVNGTCSAHSASSAGIPSAEQPGTSKTKNTKVKGDSQRLLSNNAQATAYGGYLDGCSEDHAWDERTIAAR
jgi:hypothetical protein